MMDIDNANECLHNFYVEIKKQMISSDMDFNKGYFMLLGYIRCLSDLCESYNMPNDRLEIEEYGFELIQELKKEFVK